MYEFNKFQLEWLDALESGKYKQGTKNLKYKLLKGTIKYCCLGVGCELLHLPSASFSLKTGRKVYEFVTYKCNNANLAPPELIEALKIRDGGGFIINNITTKVSSLVDMNDSGCSFKEIAKFCRENPEQVFVN